MGGTRAVVSDDIHAPWASATARGGGILDQSTPASCLLGRGAAGRGGRARSSELDLRARPTDPGRQPLHAVVAARLRLRCSATTAALAGSA